MKNKKGLLLVLSILLVCRFVLVPWYQQQQAQAEQLQVITKRLETAAALQAASDKLLDAYDEVTLRDAELHAQFPLISSSQQYRLQLQQNIQQLAEQHQLSINLFDWLADNPVVGTKVQQAMLSIRLSGRVDDLALFNAALEQRDNMAVVETNITARRAFRAADDLNLHLVIQVYFIVGESQ